MNGRPSLTQVAVIAASCCAGHICMVGGGGGCCMLLLHPVPTSADAGCDLCTLCPDLCTLHPHLWILCLWCFPSFNWCKHSTCTGGGCHQLQLALVVLVYIYMLEGGHNSSLTVSLSLIIQCAQYGRRPRGYVNKSAILAPPPAGPNSLAGSQTTSSTRV